MKRLFTLPDSIRISSRRHQFPRQQARQQRGSIMVLTTVLIVGMVGMLALAIDLGYLYSSHTQLQNGINAAALAAGAGLRVTIEGDPKAPQQENVAKELAQEYAKFNQVRRYPDPPEKSNEPDLNKIIIDRGDITVDTTTEIPTVQVKTSIDAPLFFASLFTAPFGFDRINIGAAATASLLPVDGGTGTIGSAGGRPGGCWRPLFLPDTFYNLNDTVEMVGDNSLGGTRLPNQPGDYYRSRFAAGMRNAPPFFEGIAGVGPSVTGLRDTQLKADIIGQKTVMGRLDVVFRPDFYYIADFSQLPSVKPNDRNVTDQASFGYCGRIRVGDDIPVYLRTNAAVRDQVRQGLTGLRRNTIEGDPADPIIEDMFRYVKTNGYQVPNTQGAIIPVLLYNPMLWKPGGPVDTTTVLTVTNIGLFFLKELMPDGELRGYFVREVIAGGTPIDSKNLDPEGPAFKRRWLPMSVQLIK